MSIFPDNPALFGAGGCGAHQQVMGVTVIGGGGGPENGFGSEGFFLSGEEVQPTNFFSSAYDPQYHTVNGMEVPDGVVYSPQLHPDVVDLLEQEHAIILDGVIINSDGATSCFTIRCDESDYFEHLVDETAIFSADNSDGVNTAALGVTPPLVGRYRLVIRKTNGSIEASVNGNPVASSDGDAMPYDPITTVVVEVKNGARITEFTILTGGDLPDAAELPALSAL